jgi:hypothetical protein
MKRKYHPPEIKSETAFEQEMLACLKVNHNCLHELPRQPWTTHCLMQMLRSAACYEKTKS